MRPSPAAARALLALASPLLANRIDDFDVTSSRRAEPLQVPTAEGLTIELRLSKAQAERAELATP